MSQGTRKHYCIFAYTTLASFGMGMPGSAFSQTASHAGRMLLRKSFVIQFICCGLDHWLRPGPAETDHFFAGVNS